MDICIMANDKAIMLMTMLFPIGKGLIWTNIEVGHLLLSTIVHFDI